MKIVIAGAGEVGSHLAKTFPSFLLQVTVNQTEAFLVFRENGNRYKQEHSTFGKIKIFIRLNIKNLQKNFILG